MRRHEEVVSHARLCQVLDYDLLYKDAAYRAKHKSKNKAYFAAYRAAHPEKIKARNAAWYAANSEKKKAQSLAAYTANPERARALAYRARYGITIAQYDAMFERQHGVCAICGRPPKTVRLSVEHDHRTKRVRGLVCFRCNKFLIGHHTADTARVVLAYLESDFDGRFIVAAPPQDLIPTISGE